jgi:hypothetical protein
MTGETSRDKYLAPCSTPICLPLVSVPLSLMLPQSQAERIRLYTTFPWSHLESWQRKSLLSLE